MYETFDPAPATSGPHPFSRLIDAVLREGPEATSDVEAGLRPIVEQVPAEHREGVAVAVYQPGQQRILVIRQRHGFPANLTAAVEGVRRHPRFATCDMGAARIQIDFFGVTERGMDLAHLSATATDARRFEFGVDGLILVSASVRHYFLPGDSYVRSIYGVQQLRRHLQKLSGQADLTPFTVDRIRATSVISFEGRWLRLYRGHPVPAAVAVADVERVCACAVAHILAHRRDGGRFLYYYDAATDSERNHEHPRRDPVRNPYYNELRHAGGIITLLLAAARPDRPADRCTLKAAVEDAISFLHANAVRYRTDDGRDARYISFNRKSKLGGAGLALYALALYRRTYGDSRHDAAATELFEHILAQVTESGEFLYYSIYLDRPVSAAENRQLFSFYYPGEALIGLAGYLKWVDPTAARDEEVLSTIRRALRFLIVERPRVHARHFTSLPSDAWLMAAINELWALPALRDPAHADFVLADADRMVALMYNETTAICPDYVGAFHYQPGDQPYADGARCEGLVAALELAMTRGERERVRHYATALVNTVRATIRLANTPESLYFAANPAKALGGIRFKHTRQWFRIDTIQHVVCYYYRFLDLYPRLEAEGFVLDDRLAADRDTARPGA